MSDYVYGKNSFFEALDNKRIIKAYVLNDDTDYVFKEYDDPNFTRMSRIL